MIQWSLSIAAPLVLIFIFMTPSAIAGDIVEHKFAENADVKIHYAAMGEGDLIVFIHGFPDFWYSWRHQMQGLKGNCRVVALDTRGYNKSGQPEKQADYGMSHLVQDVAAVIKAEGESKAVIVGHDWGGAIEWHFAIAFPHLTERLVIVNLPPPHGIARNLLPILSSKPMRNTPVTFNSPIRMKS